jgi:hypothetical protein
MKNHFYTSITLLGFIILNTLFSMAQTDEKASDYQQVKTYFEI